MRQRIVVEWEKDLPPGSEVDIQTSWEMTDREKRLLLNFLEESL